MTDIAPRARAGPRPASLEGTRPLGPGTRVLLARLSLQHLGPIATAVLVGEAALIAVGIYVLSPGFGRTVTWWMAALLAVIAALGLFVVAREIILWRWQRSGWCVGYFSATTSVLVHRDATGRWEMTDHMTTRRGTRQGQAFRQRVFGHLAEQADQHQATIVAGTFVLKLADLYETDMPGLQVIRSRHDRLGRTRYLLQREPNPAAPSDQGQS